MEQESSEQRLGYMERWEYLWDKFVLLLSTARSAEQGDLTGETDDCRPEK